jgi:hypothetical protein
VNFSFSTITSCCDISGANVNGNVGRWWSSWCGDWGSWNDWLFWGRCWWTRKFWNVIIGEDNVTSIPSVLHGCCRKRRTKATSCTGRNCTRIGGHCEDVIESVNFSFSTITSCCDVSGANVKGGVGRWCSRCGWLQWSGSCIAWGFGGWFGWLWFVLIDTKLWKLLLLIQPTTPKVVIVRVRIDLELHVRHATIWSRSKLEI